MYPGGATGPINSNHETFATRAHSIPAGPGNSGPGRRPLQSRGGFPAEASAELTDITRQLTTALRLQPFQVVMVNRAAARELRLFNAALAAKAAGHVPEAGRPDGTAGSASSFERELAQILTPFQLASFEQLKATTALGERLQSAVFVH